MRRTEPFLYRAVVPGSEVTERLTYFLEAVDANGRRVIYPERGREDPVVVTVTTDGEPPVIVHEPVTSAAAGKPLRISVEARDPSGVKWVRLRYRSVTQFEDYRTLEMRRAGRRFEAEVPAEHVVAKWDFMYLIEVMDAKGNGRIYPDLEKEAPYIVVKLER